MIVRETKSVDELSPAEIRFAAIAIMLGIILGTCADAICALPW